MAHTYTHVYITYYTHTHTLTHALYVHIHMYIYIYIRTHTHAHTHTRTDGRTQVDVADAVKRWSSVKDFAEFWNHLPRSPGGGGGGGGAGRVLVKEDCRFRRGGANEEGGLVESAEVGVTGSAFAIDMSLQAARLLTHVSSSTGSAFAIDISLQAAVNLATVRHRRTQGQWMMRASQELLDYRLRQPSLGALGEVGGRDRALSIVWPALLGTTVSPTSSLK